MKFLQKIVPLVLFLSALGAPCEAQVEPCVDESLIDPEAICPTVIDPVCGCNGISYNNACEAQALGGVLQWTEGVCEALPCTDLGGIDFGLCDMAMGVARIDGSCQYVSGCGAVVGGVNYAPAFFESFERKAKGEAKPCWKTDQKSKHKALQRDFGKCSKHQSQIDNFFLQGRTPPRLCIHHDGAVLYLRAQRR